MGIVKAVGNKIDVGAEVSSLSSQVDVCSGGICASFSDTGTGYGGFLQVWMDEAKKLAGGISISSHKYSKDTSSTTSTDIGVGYYVTEKDEIYGSYGNSSDSSGGSTSLSIGYSHHF